MNNMDTPNIIVDAFYLERLDRGAIVNLDSVPNIITGLRGECSATEPS